MVGLVQTEVALKENLQLECAQPDLCIVFYITHSNTVVLKICEKTHS